MDKKQVKLNKKAFTKTYILEDFNNLFDWRMVHNFW